MVARKSFSDVVDSFKDYKKKENEQEDTNTSNFAEKWWRPKLDGDSSQYVVRFIPNLYSDDLLPEIMKKVHWFGDFRANCPTSLGYGYKCPLCDKVNPLFKSENATEKKIAYARYGKKRYVANILVISDPREDGKNEGKVFMWEFGPKVMDKLTAEVDDNFIYYDTQKGANFKLKLKEVGGFVNYDESSFERMPSALMDVECLKDVEMGEIENMIYDLKSEVLNERSYITDYDTLNNIYGMYDEGEDYKKAISEYFSNRNKKADSARTAETLSDTKPETVAEQPKTEVVETQQAEPTKDIAGEEIKKDAPVDAGDVELESSIDDALAEMGITS